MHAMGTLNSAIKNCAYLRREEAISGSTEMLRWKNSEKLYFRILKFSCVCWDLPGNLITASSRPLSRTIHEGGNYDEMTCRRFIIRTNLRILHIVMLLVLKLMVGPWRSF